MGNGLQRASLDDLISDTTPIPLWVSAGAAIPLNEEGAQTSRLLMTGFAGVQITPRLLVAGGVTTINVRVRTSNLLDPDPSVPGDWSDATDAQTFPITGVVGLQTAQTITVGGAPLWVSLQVWTDGEPVTTSVLSLKVVRLVASALPAAVGDLVWTEITDAQTGLAVLGNATYGTFEYVGDLWRYTWSGASPAEGSGAQDDWLSRVVALADLAGPDFDWSNTDLWLRIDLITMSNTTFDGGPCLNLQFNDGVAVRGSNVVGYGWTDHTATNSRWFRQTASSVSIINSLATSDQRSIVFQITNNTENMIPAVSLIGVGDIPDVDATASGFGFGTDVADHEVRFGCVQAFTGPMPATTEQEFRVYWASAPKPPQPSFT